MRPLRWPEMARYAGGDLGFCLYWKSFEMFLLLFYTDVFGLSALTAGTMLILTRVLDAALGPIVGMLADRTPTRFGHFRPWVLAAAPLLAVGGVLTFTTPALGPTGKLAWAYATYGATTLVYTLGNAPYSAMLGVLTPDPARRTTLSTFQLVGANLGSTVVALGTPPLVRALGRGDARLGWQATMVIYGVAVVGLLASTVTGVTERVRPAPQARSSVANDLRDLARNAPFWSLLLVGFIVMLTIALRSATIAYLFKYVLRREDLMGWGLAFTTIPLTIGAALTPALLRVVTRTRLFVACMVAVGLLSGALYFVPPDRVGLVLLLVGATSLALGPKSPLTYAMTADVVDWSEWRTGRRATGLVFSAATFGLKSGGAVASWIAALTLAATGYVPNALQTPRAQHGILIAATLVPGACACLAALVMQTYRLDAAELASVHADLEARRRAAATA